MLRNFEALVEAVIDEGHARGVRFFMENLEEDLIKSDYIAEHGEEALFKPVLEELEDALSDGDGGQGEESVEEDEDIDEEAIDQMLAQLKEEGLIDDE